MRRIRRDQSVSSPTQRPVVREALVGEALAVDGVPAPTGRLNGFPRADRCCVHTAFEYGSLHVCDENYGCVGGAVIAENSHAGNGKSFLEMNRCRREEARPLHRRLRTATPSVLRNYTCKPAITA